MKKLLVLLIFLIVQKLGYSQRDTIYRIPSSTLAKIYTDLSICETSLSSCKEREVFYLNQIGLFNDNELMYTEIAFNDSLIIDRLKADNSNLVKKKEILLKSNKNLQKSNKICKFIIVSLLSGFLTTFTLIAI